MRKAAVTSLSLAVLASVLIFVLPFYKEQVSLQRPGEPSTVHARHSKLSSVNGLSTYFALAIPVIIAGVPLLVRFRTARTISAILLMSYVVIGVASIGLFYFPSAIAMILAASERSA